MIRKNFLTDDQRYELKQIVRKPSEEHGVARRANVMLLLHDGWSCEQVSKVLYLDDDTIREWYKRFVSGGFDGLSIFDYKGGKSYLSATQEAEHTDYLDSKLHRTTNEIRAHLRERYGLNYSHSGSIKLMDRLGFDYKPPKRIPAQANEDEQHKFINIYNQLQSELRPKEAVYFADAVHPEHRSKPAYGWIKRGENIALKSSTGRRRVNIHGAINLENFDFQFVEVEKVNADSTIALLSRIKPCLNIMKSALAHPRPKRLYHDARGGMFSPEQKCSQDEGGGHG